MEYENDLGYDDHEVVMSKLKKLIEQRSSAEESMELPVLHEEIPEDAGQKTQTAEPNPTVPHPYHPIPSQKGQPANNMQEELMHEEKFGASEFEQAALKFDLKMPSISFLDIDSEQHAGMEFANTPKPASKSTGAHSQPKMEPFGDFYKPVEAPEHDSNRYIENATASSSSANQELSSNSSAVHEKPDFVLRTVADDLLDLVRKSGKISVENAAKKLKLPLETVQSLADFLVEERIFGIEYRFTTPYIYIYKEGIKEAKGRDKLITSNLITKEQFYEKAKAKNVPYESIEGMWKKYLRENMVHINEQFLKKCREKGVPKEKVNELWEKYLSYL